MVSEVETRIAHRLEAYVKDTHYRTSRRIRILTIFGVVILSVSIASATASMYLAFVSRTETWKQAAQALSEADQAVYLVREATLGANDSIAKANFATETATKAAEQAAATATLATNIVSQVRDATKNADEAATRASAAAQGANKAAKEAETAATKAEERVSGMEDTVTGHSRSINSIETGMTELKARFHELINRPSPDY